MAELTKKLASSLQTLKELQDTGLVAIKTSDLSRTHRDRLVRNGFLQPVMKGWYIPARPDETHGESTTWFASYWGFCCDYLNSRFEQEWCLSPEQSLLLHAGEFTVPKQLVVRSPQARNKVTNFPHETSLLDLKANMPAQPDILQPNKLKVFSRGDALISCSPSFFRNSPTEVRVVLSSFQDASELLAKLLDGGHVNAAGRLAGGFRNIGKSRLADEILAAMKAADYDVREVDPFEDSSPFTFSSRETSPHANRLKLMWQQMREEVLEVFPSAEKPITSPSSYLEQVEASYKDDAYHSLSIEGYRVSEDLIEKVSSGNWNPDQTQEDRQQRDAMAARGYFQAFNAVKESLGKILEGENAGEVVDLDHGTWYREMFAPSVAAGILKASDLAGYRNDQVLIRFSRHVPPQKEVVREMMPLFFDLLRDEKEPSVRVVLGHFFFVYIHPYMDGNGRMGRFLMNAMLASGGYPWTIIRQETREEYMAALEEASVHKNIKHFAEFLAKQAQG